jgi:hypothetical protein
LIVSHSGGRVWHLKLGRTHPDFRLIGPDFTQADSGFKEAHLELWEANLELRASNPDLRQGAPSARLQASRHPFAEDCVPAGQLPPDNVGAEAGMLLALRVR